MYDETKIEVIQDVSQDTMKYVLTIPYEDIRSNLSVDMMTRMKNASDNSDIAECLMVLAELIDAIKRSKNG